MNIGDRVTVIMTMEVEGIQRDPFSNEILINGKIDHGERGNYFVSIPQILCKKIEQAHAV